MMKNLFIYKENVGLSKSKGNSIIKAKVVQQNIYSRSKIKLGTKQERASNIVSGVRVGHAKHDDMLFMPGKPPAGHCNWYDE